jgi:hypothetical protein
LEENIAKVKLSTPDYCGMKEEDAFKDFCKWRQQYMSVYVPIDKSDGGSYVKIINSCKFIANNIRGYLKLKVVHFVMNLHTLPHMFYLTWHGQSKYNMLGKIQGDSRLSPTGVEYAKQLAEFAWEHIATHTNSDGTTEHIPAWLWTSTLRRTKEMAQFLQHPKLQYVTHGIMVTWVIGYSFSPWHDAIWMNCMLEYAMAWCTRKLKNCSYQEELKWRQDDKLAYQYPRGMSILYYYYNTCIYIVVIHLLTFFVLFLLY